MATAEYTPTMRDRYIKLCNAYDANNNIDLSIVGKKLRIEIPSYIDKLNLGPNKERELKNRYIRNKVKEMVKAEDLKQDANKSSGVLDRVSNRLRRREVFRAIAESVESGALTTDSAKYLLTAIFE